MSATATGRADARAALLGNPSDGFGGRTIAFALPELGAEVAAAPAAGATVEAAGERLGFANAADLVSAGNSGGYPAAGPTALLMATAKRFAERLAAGGAALEDVGFELRLERSTIPPQVGLAGSSAIVVAALRALGELFEHEIPREELPGVALACEAEELGIVCGLQDRVAQTYGGLVYMDLDLEIVAARGHGHYEPLDPGLLPPLLVAHSPAARSDSGAAHVGVRERFEAGDPEVIETMAAIAALADAGREALAAGDERRLGELLDRNLELRARVYDLDPRHLALVEAARAAGAAVNYAGSGGAIVALPAPGGSLDALADALAGAGYESLAPVLA